MKSTLTAFLAIVLFAAVSCKNEKDAPREVTPENLAGSYKITKIEVKVGGVKEDVTAEWFSNEIEGECAKDNITTFSPNGTFMVAEGTLNCNDRRLDKGTWAVTNRNTINVDDLPVTVDIFTDKTLTIVEDYSSANMQSQIIKTYTRVKDHKQQLARLF